MTRLIFLVSLNLLTRSVSAPDGQQKPELPTKGLAEH